MLKKLKKVNMTTTKAEQLLVSTGYDLFGSNDDVKKIMAFAKDLLHDYCLSGVKYEDFVKDYFEDTIEVEGD